MFREYALVARLDEASSVSKLATFVVDAVILEDLVLRPRDGGVKPAL